MNDGTRRTRSVHVAACLLALSAASGCVVGPKYQVPSLPPPPARYKELTPAQPSATPGWKVAQPQDDRIHGKWWEMFDDPDLNALEEQVNISNQNIAAAFASFLQARALVKEARAQYFPQITTSPGVIRSREPTSITQLGAQSGSSSATSFSFTDYSLPFDASWTPDLWGRIRQTVQSSVAAAQASAADLENARLTAQAEVAVDYYELRAQDSLRQLLDAAVAAYRESLELTRVLYQTGIDMDEAVAQAEVQLQTTQAQDTNLGIVRAQYEHAIALLVGQSASSFSIAVKPLGAEPPAVPVGIPSVLLERRPDVAAGERLMAQANAQIGVAQSAYYPTLNLSLAAGFEDTSLATWLSWPSRFWSVGSALSETLFDAGLRKATVEQYQAAFQQTVANYRQTVLAAFQQVEDNLAALRMLSQEIQQQDMAVRSSQRYLDIALDRYKLGLDPYLNVITAQTALLSNQQAAVNLKMEQLTASVQLVEALGGGWDVSQLPALH